MFYELFLIDEEKYTEEEKNKIIADLSLMVCPEAKGDTFENVLRDITDYREEDRNEPRAAVYEDPNYREPEDILTSAMFGATLESWKDMVDDLYKLIKKYPQIKLHCDKYTDELEIISYDFDYNILLHD